MDQHSTEAPEVMARLVRVADRYTSRWRESNDDHFRRAAKMVGRFIAGLRAESEADPDGFLRDWACVMTIPDIAAMRKILEAAKEGSR